MRAAIEAPTAIAAATSLEGQGRYRALARRKLLILALLAAALVLSFAVGLAWDPARYGLDQVVLALFKPGAVSDQVRTVVWDIRMPVAVMALVVGAALSAAGAQMQTILANPLASPFTLGISAATCAAANEGYDFSFVNIQHQALDLSQVIDMYDCGDVPATFSHGARIPDSSERWIQAILDGGAMTLVVPTVDTKEEPSRSSTGRSSRRWARAAAAAA